MESLNDWWTAVIKIILSQTNTNTSKPRRLPTCLALVARQKGMLESQGYLEGHERVVYKSTCRSKEGGVQDHHES
jgi:hypothetical protein